MCLIDFVIIILARQIVRCILLHESRCCLTKWVIYKLKEIVEIGNVVMDVVRIDQITPIENEVVGINTDGLCAWLSGGEDQLQVGFVWI